MSEYILLYLLYEVDRKEWNINIKPNKRPSTTILATMKYNTSFDCTYYKKGDSSCFSPKRIKKSKNPYIWC